ncbi:MAG TPA: energy-coupling factor transporter ATPase, partial [Firmicutes bacterium]|nr:energy-coupling factor transporter ATPase [Bacillota bacterium]
MVNFEHVFYVYNPKSPVEFEALHDVSLTIGKGEFVALVGRTGSGKSTLIQHINALMKPSQGKVVVNGYENSPKLKHKGKEILDLRKNVGLVFQFPENQLFEETVEKDVAFAPKNFGMNEKDALEKAHEALLKVGLDESFFKRSPFELSGGEKRRV